ncbi:MAG: hypothetical protein RBT80_16520 [Candidatus Vecturithrix sp.]|jgi:hypothetical protein|nr:hypothetical protein [Candidatus Vecturithrix sp.]
MGLAVEQHSMFDNVEFFPYQKPSLHVCWQHLLGVNVLNLYRLLEEKGDYQAMQWLEHIQLDDYVVEVSSLPCPYRDRERIGKVIAIGRNYVLIQTDDGQRVKWVNGKLLKVPETVMY